jgi:hypothetical protein
MRTNDTEHAKEVAKKLGKSDFTGSNRWLESFRKRHQVVFNAVCKCDDVSDDTVANWFAKLPSIMHGYKLTDTRKRDENGLFHPLPCKILCSKGKKFSGGKLCKGG